MMPATMSCEVNILRAAALQKDVTFIIWQAQKNWRNNSEMCLN